jgi:hypothetical protein
MTVRIRALVSLLALAGAVFATGCVASAEPEGESDPAADPAPAAPAAPTSAGSTSPVSHDPNGVKERDWRYECYDYCMEFGGTTDDCACGCKLESCEV